MSTSRWNSLAGTLRRWLQSPRTRSRDRRDVLAVRRGLAAARMRPACVHRDFGSTTCSSPRTAFRASLTSVSSATLRAASRHRTSRSPAGHRSSARRSTWRPSCSRNAAATEKSDQFAFCVALSDALYGRPPFAGNTIEELTNAVLAGSSSCRRVRASPRGSEPRSSAASQRRPSALADDDGAPSPSSSRRDGAWSGAYAAGGDRRRDCRRDVVLSSGTGTRGVRAPSPTKARSRCGLSRPGTRSTMRSSRPEESCGRARAIASAKRSTATGNAGSSSPPTYVRRSATPAVPVPR